MMKHPFFLLILLLISLFNMLYGSSEIADVLIDYQNENGFKPIVRLMITDKRKVQDNNALSSIAKKEITQSDLDIKFISSEDFTEQYYSFQKRPVYYHNKTNEIQNKFEQRTIIIIWLKSNNATFMDMNFSSPKENDTAKTIKKRAHVEENGLLKVAVNMCMGLKDFNFEINAPEGYCFPVTLEEDAETKEVFTVRDMLYQKAAKWLTEDLIKAKMKEADPSLSQEAVITPEIAEQISKEVRKKLPRSMDTEALFAWLNKHSAEIWKPVLEDANKFRLNPGNKEFRSSRKKLMNKINALKEEQKKKIEELKAKREASKKG